MKLLVEIIRSSRGSRVEDEVAHQVERGRIVRPALRGSPSEGGTAPAWRVGFDLSRAVERLNPSGGGSLDRQAWMDDVRRHHSADYRRKSLVPEGCKRFRTSHALTTLIIPSYCLEDRKRFSSSIVQSSKKMTPSSQSRVASFSWASAWKGEEAQSPRGGRLRTAIIDASISPGACQRGGSLAKRN